MIEIERGQYEKYSYYTKTLALVLQPFFHKWEDIIVWRLPLFFGKG